MSSISLIASLKGVIASVNSESFSRPLPLRSWPSQLSSIGERVASKTD